MRKCITGASPFFETPGMLWDLLPDTVWHLFVVLVDETFVFLETIETC